MSPDLKLSDRKINEIHCRSAGSWVRGPINAWVKTLVR